MPQNFSRNLKCLVIIMLLLMGCAPPPRLQPVTTITGATSAPVVAKPQTTNTLQTIADDMRLPHAAKLHGVPAAYDWADKPRLGRGNDPGVFKAFIAWGQVYESAQGNPAINTRVQLRNLEGFLLSKKTGQWTRLQFSVDVDGAAFKEDFANNASQPPQQRREPDGGVSVTAGGGYNFHFWCSCGRTVIDPRDVAGVFTTAQARLILGDATKPDDRATAQYLLGMGADYWLDQSGEWKADWSANGDVGIGRMKFVTNDWQAFNMTTLSLNDLEKNPPPLR